MTSAAADCAYTLAHMELQTGQHPFCWALDNFWLQAGIICTYENVLSTLKEEV